MTVQIVFDPANASQAALAQSAAAAWRGRDPLQLHGGRVAAAADAEIRIVFEDAVAAYLGAIGDERRADAAARTLVLDADRGGVLELLETHGLGGAIECDGPEAWHESGRLFVRKAAIVRAGEASGGAGRESPRYVLWRDPRSETLIQLVEGYARACIAYARRDEQLIVTREAAREHGLPAVGFQVTVGGVGSMPVLFPGDGCYVRFDGSFGGASWRVVDAPAGKSLEDAIRHELRAARTRVVVGDPETIVVGGVRREAIAAFHGDPARGPRLVTCVVRMPHADGALQLVCDGRDMQSPRPSCEQMFAEGPYKVIADSFRVGE